VLLAGLDATRGFSVAPDSRRLSYVRRQDRASLWLVAAGGEGLGKPRRLDAGMLPKQAPSVSPDGKQVAFGQVDSSANVFTLALEGGTPKQVSSLAGVAINATAWSPDGAEIVFTATLKDGTSRVYVVPARGGEARAVGREAPSQGLAWSPGHRIVYQLAGNRNYSVLDPVSLAEHRLWSSEAGWAFYPSISPDGERAAFLWNREDAQGYGVWTVSLADGSSRFTAPGVAPLGYGDEGRTLYAFGPTKAPIRELFEVPAGGGTPVRVGALPFERPVTEMALVPGTRSFVCVVSEADSDIWFVEGFDPEAAAH
jgi:Tol biopolymer transport system component